MYVKFAIAIALASMHLVVCRQGFAQDKKEATHSSASEDPQVSVERTALVPIPAQYTPFNTSDFNTDLKVLLETSKAIKDNESLADFIAPLQKMLSRSQNWYCQGDKLINLHHNARDLIYSNRSLHKLFETSFAAKAEQLLKRQLDSDRLDLNALSDIAYAYRTTPASQSALFMLTQSYLDRGEYELAALYANTLTSDYAGVEPWPLLWMAYAYQGDQAKLKDSIKTFTQKFPDQTTIRTARKNYSLNDFEESILQPVLQRTKSKPAFTSLHTEVLSSPISSRAREFYRAIRFTDNIAPSHISFAEYIEMEKKCFEQSQLWGLESYITELLAQDPKPEIFHGKIQIIGEDAYPVLVKYLQGSKFQGVSMVTYELQESKFKIPVATYIKLLRHHNTITNNFAIRSLGKLGPEARGAVPHLIAILKSIKEPEIIMAADSLAQIGAASVEKLTAALEHHSPITAENAARALGEIGKPAKPAIPNLIKLTKHPKEDVRKAAITAIQAIERAK